ncbi:MAG TPA: DNA polymerase IV, partial [Beutenbergiaceae bacterium]|nr:DNA polymerase IV [Beutenbergiaceae bacterium]
TDVARDIYRAARALFDAVTIPSTGVRLVGVRVERLSNAATTAVQPVLGEEDHGHRHAEQAMDAVQARFGSQILRAGSLIKPPATENRRRGIS